jgi:hypothetical protein
LPTDEKEDIPEAARPRTLGSFEGHRVCGLSGQTGGRSSEPVHGVSGPTLSTLRVLSAHWSRRHRAYFALGITLHGEHGAVTVDVAQWAA